MDRLPTRARGMTLVEIIIVVAIVGILATIAVPAYDSFQVKRVRAEGQHCLNAVQTRMEKFFVRNHAYATSMTALGYTNLSSGAYRCPIGDDADPSDGYLVALKEFPDGASCPKTLCYALVTKPYGRQDDDGVLKLTTSRAGIGASGKPVVTRTRTEPDGTVKSW